MRKNNENNKREYEISVSFGYKSKEQLEDITIWDAYKMADKSMYEYKQAYKKAQGENEEC